MLKDKKRAIRERLTRKHKREVIAGLMEHLKYNWSELSKRQVRRVFSHAYQMLRERKAR